MAVPELPRDQWVSHPRYPSQALLLGSHEGFRNMSAWVIKAVSQLDPDDPSSIRKRQRWLTRYRDDFAWWMTGMKAHERYEERRLYPYLARRYDVMFAHLQRGHRVLDDHQRAVRAAFADVVPGAEREVAAMAALRAALTDHQRTLLEHLREEEDLILPMLLELDPDEFSALTTEPLETLLSRPR